MPVFDESYFREEVRSGFSVPSMMKRVWAADVKVLSEVLGIAKTYGITCFAGFGTLLGTVRHRGFIPWDDDLDLVVKRADYIRLFGILERELPPHYQIYSHYTNTPNKEPQGCIMNRRTPDFGFEEDRRITEEFFGCPYVIGLDIFPLDQVPEDPEDRSLHTELYSAVYDAAQRFEELSASGELPSILLKLEELLGVSFSKEKSLDIQLWELADQVAMLYMEDDTRLYTDMKSTAMRGQAPIFPAEWYDSALMLPFENIRIPVPVGYQGVLTELYGQDFMRRQQFTATHDYPFYKKQEEWRKRRENESMDTL